MNYQEINENNFEKSWDYLQTLDSNSPEYLIILIQISNYHCDKFEELINLLYLFLEKKIKHNIYTNDKFKNFIIETTEMKFSASLFFMGSMYDQGKGVDYDCSKAIELYKMAIEKGNSYAMNNLAEIYEYKIGTIQKIKEAIELYHMAVDKENVYAMNNLADKYYNGKGIEQNHQKAIELYKNAIKKGNNLAMNNLAFIYNHTNTIKNNYQKAIKYYKMAIRNKNIVSINNLAFMYKEGTGIKKNFQKAIALYIIAIQKSNSDALYFLEKVCKHKPIEMNRFLQKLLEKNSKRKLSTKQIYEKKMEEYFSPDGEGFRKSLESFNSLISLEKNQI